MSKGDIENEREEHENSTISQILVYKRGKEKDLPTRKFVNFCSPTK